MKKIVATFIFIIILISQVFAETPTELMAEALMSEAAILIDPQNGNVLFGQNIHQQMYPASTTKVMTALLAIEFGDLSDMVVVNQSALDGMVPLAARLGLTEGEEMPLLHLVQAIMLMSGNDAANVIAEHIAGDIDSFVELMNERAIELGAYNTNFANPTGLHHDDHVSTVYDMAIISRYAMAIPEFRGIVVNAHLFLDETNLHEERRYIVNTNSMISRIVTPNYYFAPTIGVKTGRTTQAGLCLVAAAGRGRPFELISVTFNAPQGGTRNYSFIDSRALFEYGYSNFRRQTIVARRDVPLGEVRLRGARGGNHLPIVTEEPLTALLPIGMTANDLERRLIVPEYLRAPIERGQLVGEIEFLQDGNVIGQVNLLASRDVERHVLWFIFLAVDYLWSFLFVRIIVYVLLGLVVLYLFVLITGIRNAVKKSKRM